MDQNREVPLASPVVSKPSASEHIASNQPGRGQGLRDTVSFVGVLLSALLLAFGLISFVFQSYQVSGPSMQTTLHDKDHLIVWKVPRTWARITGHAYVPKRGDVVIVHKNLAAYGDPGVNEIIKRVIGLPGDRVIVKNGVVTIYNKAHPKGFDPDRTLAYGKAIGSTSGDIAVTLRANQIYVCGDNRGDSEDSRFFGPVATNDVVGTLALRVLPLNTAQLF
jgi:signal peptidase I